MSRKVFWHLPGLCVHFYLNQVIINLMKEFPDKFRDGYEVGSVYGTFPGAIWNGGRAVFGIMDKDNMSSIIKTYNNLEVPVRFTWTNSLLEEKHVNDTYCNLIMDLANNGMNQVLVNRQVLEDYLRDKYPDFKYISSTTKRIVSLEGIQEELKKDYFMCVLDYDMNHNQEILNTLEPYASRIEILVDEICSPHCSRRTAHYQDEALKQLSFEKSNPFPCNNRNSKPSFEDCMKREAFIGNEEIDSYIDRGFVNFKIVGRGLPPEMVEESYLYYLVKEDERAFIKEKMDKTLNKLRNMR